MRVDMSYDDTIKLHLILEALATWVEHVHMILDAHDDELTQAAVVLIAHIHDLTD